ncbi:MAG: hypothetical protein ACR2PM_16810, partial [Hyphomicrobiales bacterium]
RVEDPVYGDGLLHIFSLRTNYGSYRINGNAFVAARILELRALASLNEASQSETFVDAAVKSGLSPVEFAGNAVKNPVGTVVNTVSGLGGLFGRIASGVTNPGASEEGLIADVAGVSAAKRAIAAKLGVDPYTDFEPLDNKLTQVARATALGGLGVKVALTAIPGVAGTAISGVSTAGSVTNLIRDKTPAQLLDLNRSRLKSMGVGRKTIKRFLKNERLTPSDQTVIVAALSQLSGVRNRAIFVQRAAGADTRELVFVHRARAEMLARHHKSVGKLGDFISVKGLVFNRTRDGQVLGVVPLDLFAWTELAGGALQVVTQELKRKKMMNGGELRISGRATPLARKMAEALGWRVVEGIR